MSVVLKTLKNKKKELSNITELTLMEINPFFQEVAGHVFECFDKNLENKNPVIVANVKRLGNDLRKIFYNLHALCKDKKGEKPFKTKLNYLQLQTRDKKLKQEPVDRCIFNQNVWKVNKHKFKKEWTILHTVLSNFSLQCFEKIIEERIISRQIYINIDWYRNKVTDIISQLETNFQQVYGSKNKTQYFIITTGKVRFSYSANGKPIAVETNG